MKDEMPMNEISILLTIYRILKKHIKFVMIFIIIGTLGTVLYTFTMVPMYRSEAIILPGEDEDSVAQPQGLISIAGLSAGPTQQQKLMAIFQTRALKEYIITHYKLLDKLVNVDAPNQSPAQLLEDAINNLSSMVSFDILKTAGGISVSAVSAEPEMSLKFVDYYIEALRYFINNYALNKATYKRIFIEKQLINNKIALLEAGKGLAEFYKKYGVSNIEAKINVPIHIDPVIKDEVLNDKIQALEDKKDRLDEKLQSQLVKDVPQQVYLNYLTLNREILSELSSLLNNQYEYSKIMEAKKQLVFQVIDPPVLPLKPYKPNKSFIVTIGFVLSIILSLGVVFFREYISSLNESEKRQR